MHRSNNYTRKSSISRVQLCICVVVTYKYHTDAHQDRVESVNMNLFSTPNISLFIGAQRFTLNIVMLINIRSGPMEWTKERARHTNALGSPLTPNVEKLKILTKIRGTNKTNRKALGVLFTHLSHHHNMLRRCSWLHAALGCPRL